jgi:ubiquinone/menaquinone biosynthesis C-methylase UbiE
MTTESKSPLKNEIVKHSIIALNLSKTVLYSLEYKSLMQLSKTFSAFVTPPKEEKNKKLLEHLKNGVIDIHQKDAENILANIYPASVLVPKSALDHLLNIPTLLIDSLKISRRRKLNSIHDFNVENNDYPEYLKRNYHFQTDGYFSEHSASLYEQQVEVLFSGTAGPMRRMLIQKVKQKLKESNNLGRPLRILEIGAGVGSATLDFKKSFNIEKYTVTDISTPYLKHAKKRLSDSFFEFVTADAEKLPFKDEEFDLVFSIYLFHEIPRNHRERILAESKRVLKKGGVLGICDSLQLDDDHVLNEVLHQFPIDYHEPFYRDYTKWNANETLSHLAFEKIESSFHLLSKYWVANK